MTTLAVALALWAGLNIWATMEVRRVAVHLHKPGMLIAGIWLWPVVGVLVARNQVRAYAAIESVEQASPPVHQPPPADAPEWLLELQGALGPHFHFKASRHALLLSSLEPNVAAATVEYVERSRKRIERTLGTLAKFPNGLRSTLVVFDDEDGYYGHVSRFYPSEGEFSFSGGMFIGGDHPHFVTRRADLSQIEPVIAHELTHSALAYLELPLWLDEGIAVNTEHRLCGKGPSAYSAQELRAMHLRFWNPERVEEFWAGESFRRTDEGNLLSYDLARIIVEQTGRDWAAFSRFVAAAHYSDAGADAARTLLGVDLHSYVAALLDWQVEPVFSTHADAVSGS